MAVLYHARRTAASGFRAPRGREKDDRDAGARDHVGTAVARRRVVHRLLIVALMMAAGPSPARAPRMILGGRVDRVVATGSGVAALRGGEAVLLARDGRVVSRCGSTAAQPIEHRHDGTMRDAEDVLREADLDGDDESPEAEDVLDDEGFDVDRPRHRAGPPTTDASRALAIAGAADAVWIGTTDGLRRLDARTGACPRVALGGRAIGVVAVAGRTLVVADDATIWRSDDGAASFRVAAVLPSPARAAAVTDGGALALVADDDGVVELEGGRETAPRLDTSVASMIACGGDVLALADDALIRFGIDGEREVLGSRPPVRAFACTVTNGVSRLAAAGVGAWTSADGRAWADDAALAGRSFADVALTADGVWLAGDDGLRGPALAASSFEPSSTDVSLPRLPRTAARARPAWAALLPRLTFVYQTWAESQGRAGWRCWALLTFSIDRRARARVNAQPETSP